MQPILRLTVERKGSDGVAPVYSFWLTPVQQPCNRADRNGSFWAVSFSIAGA
jgi:hypothetical protein